MGLTLLSVIAGACMAVTASGALAQPPGGALTLDVALRRALEQRPDLATFQYELRAQQARIGEADLAPAMEAEIVVEDAGGTGTRENFSAAQTTLSLSNLIELGGKRAGRVSVQRAALDALYTAQQTRRIDAIADVARRFVETLHGQAILALSRENVLVVTRTRDAVAARVKAARVPEVEAVRAQVRLTQAHLELEHAEHELQSQRRLLAAAMGERELTFAEVTGDLLHFTPAITLDELEDRLEVSPGYLRFADEARLRDAQIRLAELTRKPDVRAEFGARRYEDGNDYAFVAGLSVPLSSSRRAESSTELARAERQRTDADRTAWLDRVSAQLFAEYQELEHARREVDTLQHSVIPQLEQAFEQTEAAYRRGRYSYLEWNDARRELLAARRQQIDQGAAFHTVRIEIERLTGHSLDVEGGKS